MNEGRLPTPAKPPDRAGFSCGNGVREVRELGRHRRRLDAGITGWPWGMIIHATLADLSGTSRWPASAGRHVRTLIVFALFAALPAASRAQTAPSALPGWQFSVTPYLWAPTIDGTLRYSLPGTGRGATSADARISSINLLESLDGAAMIAAEARYDRFSVLTDFIYLSFGKSTSEIRSVSFQGSRTAVSAGLNAGTESFLNGSLWTLAGAYTLAHGSWGHLDASAGFRLFSLSGKTDVRSRPRSPRRLAAPPSSGRDGWTGAATCSTGWSGCVAGSCSAAAFISPTASTSAPARRA